MSGTSAAKAYVDGYRAALRGVLVMVEALSDVRAAPTPEMDAVSLYCQRTLELLPTVPT